MRLSLRFSYVALLIGICSLVYGNEIQNQDVLDHICEYAQSSIEKVEDQKVFFKSENLWLHKGQFYVAGDYGDSIRIPHLLSDGNGLYVLQSKKTTIYICRDCTKAYYNYKPDSCERCLCKHFLVRFQ
jgi:hypothetical protein